MIGGTRKKSKREKKRAASKGAEASTNKKMQPKVGALQPCASVESSARARRREGSVGVATRQMSVAGCGSSLSCTHSKTFQKERECVVSEAMSKKRGLDRLLDTEHGSFESW